VTTVNRTYRNVPRYTCNENDVRDCTVRARFVTEWDRKGMYTEFW
jgi:hypothetical protein